MQNPLVESIMLINLQHWNPEHLEMLLQNFREDSIELTCQGFSVGKIEELFHKQNIPEILWVIMCDSSFWILTHFILMHQ